MKTEKIGVLMGGLSSEREVSLQSGAGVLRALRERGWDAVGIDWAPGTSLPALLDGAGVDAVWNALHGTYGEDGAVQGLLACMGIACTGSGILASALAMDKVASKRIFESCGLATPRWAVIEPGATAAQVLGDWEQLPLVVKPANEGSSVGVSIVRAAADLPAALELARRHQGPTLVEEFIAGAELCTGILGEQVLASCEIRPAVDFYDYDAKYVRDDTQYLVPPPLDAAVLAEVEKLALAAHRALGCTGYSRVDFRLRADGVPFLLEVNTLPGMTSHSLIPKCAAHVGIDYATLCERILGSALS
ncbi:MAG TPA: D-alanine--D-alanine ligase [Kofleriaceae bacterium]|nr:D-alanine--D-alanine ligase [Kofleriaceae bacterium]